MNTCQSGAIGILGGIFDPVHNGHLALASLAQESLGLERVIFVPAGVPPHKRSTVSVPASHRLAMLEAATAGNPSFEILDCEIRRDTVSYTVDTLKLVSGRFPGIDLYFLIGSDNITEIVSWRDYRTILDMVTLAVAHRPGYAGKPPRELSGARIRRFPSPEWGISSTMVRTYLADGLSCRYMVPGVVEKYIEENGLYRGT